MEFGTECESFAVALKKLSFITTEYSGVDNKHVQYAFVLEIHS